MTYSRARIGWTLFAIVAVTIGTAIAVRFAQGYRPSRDTIVAGSGLLVSNSTPTGARVFVNGRFTSATNDTLYLDPGDYTVEIQKDGYFPWKKQMKVEKELVTQANALLFPVAPSLTPLTYSGATDPIPSPDGQRLVFYSASSSAETRNGYFVQELTDNPLALQRGPRQIARASTAFSPQKTQVVWSPNSSQILLHSDQKSVLIDPNKLNEIDNLPDISLQLAPLFSQWEEEMYLRDRDRLAKFPPLIQEMASQSAVNVYFSPDEKKLMYTAQKEVTLPENLLPAKPASSTQAQERTAQIGGVYIYDREEDRQFRIGTDRTLSSFGLHPKQILANDLYRQQPLTSEASPSAFTRLTRENTKKTIATFQEYHTPLYTTGYQWFPNSIHFISHDDTGLTITEYDNTNPVRVYSGPFNSNFVYPWPNGNRLIILTSFNLEAQAPENLYTIELK